MTRGHAQLYVYSCGESTRVLVPVADVREIREVPHPTDYPQNRCFALVVMKDCREIAVEGAPSEVAARLWPDPPKCDKCGRIL